MDKLCAHRAALLGQLGRAHVVLRAAVSRHGLAQLTWRESLRGIEAGLSANASRLHAIGFRAPVKRSTLADANEVVADRALEVLGHAKGVYEQLRRWSLSCNQR